MKRDFDPQKRAAPLAASATEEKSHDTEEISRVSSSSDAKETLKQQRLTILFSPLKLEHDRPETEAGDAFLVLENDDADLDPVDLNNDIDDYYSSFDKPLQFEGYHTFYVQCDTVARKGR